MPRDGSENEVHAPHGLADRMVSPKLEPLRLCHRRPTAYRPDSMRATGLQNTSTRALVRATSASLPLDQRPKFESSRRLFPRPVDAWRRSRPPCYVGVLVHLRSK